MVGTRYLFEGISGSLGLFFTLISTKINLVEPFRAVVSGTARSVEVGELQVEGVDKKEKRTVFQSTGLRDVVPLRVIVSLATMKDLF